MAVRVPLQAAAPILIELAADDLAALERISPHLGEALLILELRAEVLGMLYPTYPGELGQLWALRKPDKRRGKQAPRSRNPTPPKRRK